MFNLNGKKTYLSLATALVGLILVYAETKFGLAGVKEWGMVAIAGGLGGATYGRAVANKIVTPVRRTRKARAKKTPVSG
jgi:hypothetical protein